MSDTKTSKPKMLSNANKVENVSNAIDGEVVLANEPKKPEEPHAIAKALDKFLAVLDDYMEVIPVALITVAEQRRRELQKLIEKLEKVAKKVERREIDGETIVVTDGVGVHALRDLMETSRTSDRLLQSQAMPIIRKSFFIGLFSEYDSFIGELL